ncbi:MAG: hypothetical protein ACR2N7_03155 [Acidimicrobiia bacterium]
MSTQNMAETITTLQSDDELAEVIELPNSDQPSFYQRNSGGLPKANTGLTDAHKRAELPAAENQDSAPMIDRIKSLLRR